MNQSTSKLWLYGIVALVLISIFSFISMRNQLITLQESTDESWAQVQNQLQRRYDLVPNLVNSVKGYAKQEQTVFKSIADARAKLAGGGTVSAKVAASNQMESAISRLLVVVENYPTLKSDQTFIRLMDELSGTENRVAVERRRFNENVREFNTTIRKFPYSAVSSSMGLKKMDYFKNTPESEKAPTVSF